jgi:regulator of nucleoside diphosphate kinase
MKNDRTIVITESDMDKLDKLIDSSMRTRVPDREHLRVLRAELDRAEVVNGEVAPRNVVVMNAWVGITDLDTGLTHEYQVVFPRDADLSKNKISVLAPIGTALLGYRTGSEIEWAVPGGVRRFRIDRVKRPVARSRMALQAA